MVYIQQYNSTQAYITTLSNAKIAELQEEEHLPVSRFYWGDEAQHWVAEPSALTALYKYSKDHGHLFTKIQMV
ncbi:hypothetical protein S0112_032 [Shewanella phage S0112]|nr:hypothetical protein S0112_032 [Shewanella phage S0112]